MKISELDVIIKNGVKIKTIRATELKINQKFTMFKKSKWRIFDSIHELKNDKLLIITKELEKMIVNNTSHVRIKLN